MTFFLLEGGKKFFFGGGELKSTNAFITLKI